MVAKYNILEKDIYKRMFNTDKKVQVKAIMDKDQNEVEFVIDQKCAIDKSKELIASKLK